ncbi:protein phosphatase 2C domain-containing protein [Streptomyces sp. NPDC046805]|uniref:protein phosphatase 2C domain-containing protein n=1 Tax=Streptomyces sp. NPDC046805 TaxID=3155134 RepID=UPI0034046623
MGRLESITIPGSGSASNEDCARVCLRGDEGEAVVLDGVTGRGPDASGCRHGVAWFVDRVGDALLASLGRRCDASGDAVMRDIVRTALSAARRTHERTCDLSNALTPQATAALAAWTARTLTLGVLCDCYAVVRYVDGHIEVFEDAALRVLEQRHPPQRMEAFRNTDDGFHTLAADPSVAKWLRTWEIPASGVESLLMVSDGAARFVFEYGLGHWHDLMRLVEESGVAALARRVREFENEKMAGPGKNAETRKPSDDLTAVLLQFDA